MIRPLDQNKLNLATSSKINIKIGDYINDGFSIYSRNWVEFSVYTFLSMILIILSVITIVGPYLMMFPIQMGYSNAVEKIQKGESIEMNDFFVGFKKWTSFIPYLLILILVGIGLMVGIFIYIGGFGFLANENEIFTAILGVSILSIIPIVIILSLLLSVATFLIPYLIYHGNMSTMDCIKASIKISTKNFLYLLLFIFLFSIISQIGVYLCVIGMFVTIPAAHIMSYLLVKDILLVDNQNEITDFGQSKDL